MPDLGNLRLLIPPDPHKPAIRPEWAPVAKLSWDPLDGADYAARISVTAYTDAGTVGEVRGRVVGSGLTTPAVTIRPGAAIDLLSGYVRLGTGVHTLIVEGRVVSGPGKMRVTNVGNGVALTALADFTDVPAAGTMSFVGGALEASLAGSFIVPTEEGAPSTPGNLTATPGDGQVTFTWTAPTLGGDPDGYLFEWEVVGAPVEVLYNLNVGGPAVTVGGTTWEADDPTLWTGGTVHDYGSTQEIAGTTNDVLYRTQRWGANMARYFDVPDGTYVVTLRVAEQTPGYISQGVGARVWDAAANGATWDDVDVWDLVEGYRMASLERVVTAEEGQGIYVEFTASVAEAFVNAISIRTGDTAAPDPAPMTHAPVAPTDTSDPAATAATQEVLATLVDYAAATGTASVLAGQHLNGGRTNTTELDAIFTQTGERVAVMSFDVAERFSSQMVTIASSHWNAGGLVQVGAHSPNPVTGLNAFTDVQSGDPGAVNHATLLTSGNAQNAALVNHLNDVADFFQALAAQGVSVVYRPFHEVTNSSFWWCPNQNTTQTAARYRALYNYAWNHITNVRGCHNVVWLWSNHKNFNSASSALGTRQDWMPDASKVDVGGLSFYGFTAATPESVDVTRTSDFLAAFAAKWPGKPAVLSEVGGSTDTGGFDTRALQNIIHTAFPGRFAYFVAWSGSKHRLNTAANQAILSDTKTAWRDDLAGVAPPPPPPPANNVKGDSNLPGADADKLSTPGVLAMFNFNNGDTSRWGVQTQNNADNLLMPTSDPSFSGNDGRFGRWTCPGNLTYPEARWGGSIYPKLENIDVDGRDDLYFRYYVYFPADYVWTHGKLPGLGGKVGSGGISEGGNFDKSSFSCKLLFQRDRGLSNYVYVWGRGNETITTKSNPNRGWSTRFVRANGSISNVFTPETWHKVVVRCRMNTSPSAKDGIQQVWVDDHMGIDTRNYQYRTPEFPDLDANFVLFTWFFGGPQTDMPNYNSAGQKVANRFVDVGFDRMLVGTSYAAVS